MKYVIVDSEGIETAIEFSELLKYDIYFNPVQVISAGFCALDKENKNKVRVWVKSIILGKSSRPEDSEIIEHSFKFCGI